MLEVLLLVAAFAAALVAAFFGLIAAERAVEEAIRRDDVAAGK